MKSLKFLLLLVFVLAAQLAPAQKIIKVKGHFSYQIPEDISIEKAKQNAIQHAKEDALRKAFNTKISQSTSTVMEDVNGKSNSRMSFASSQISEGEWIETIGQEITKELINDDFFIHVTIEGRAREIKRHLIDLQYKIMKHPDATNAPECTEFNSGDHIYLSFRTPVSGYLSVFLENRAKGTVYCLLPYKRSLQSIHKVEADTDYVFFNKKDARDRTVVPFTITVKNNHTDYYDMIIVFSPNEFYKPNTVANGREGAMELSEEDFTKWYNKHRVEDDKMTLERKVISIKGNRDPSMEY